MSDRLALLRVTPEFLLELCKAGPPRFAKVIANPLPEDATFVRVGYDPTGALLIVVRSESFEAISHDMGQALPELPPPMFEVVH